MLSAGDAKKKTQSNIDNCTTKELRLSEKQINKAIFDGRFSISNNGFLESVTEQKLKELGYKVTTYAQYNESSYTISWQ